MIGDEFIKDGKIFKPYGKNNVIEVGHIKKINITFDCINNMQKSFQKTKYAFQKFNNILAYRKVGITRIH